MNSGNNVQRCFTSKWQGKDWVNLLSILIADLLFKYTEINAEKSLNTFFSQFVENLLSGYTIESFFKIIDLHEKRRFRFFCVFLPSLQSPPTSSTPPPQKKIKDGKMAGFGFRAASSLICGGEGGMGVCCSILLCPRL